MGKITVKHYLNTNLKPYIIGGDKYYKIYVLIRADTQNTKIKSDVSANEYTEKEFEELITDATGELGKAIKEETKIIEYIVNKMSADGKVFTSALYTEYSNKFKTPIGEFIEKHNSYHDPLFANPTRYIEIGTYYDSIKQKLLTELPGVIAKNYEVEDLFLVQWFTLNLKEAIKSIYKKVFKNAEFVRSDADIKMDIEHLENEIKTHLRIK